jgi:hypothetical protein
VRRASLFWIVSLAFVVISAASADTLINTDFSKGSTGWVLNNDATLATVDGRQLMQLTVEATSQTGVIWTELKRTVPSFSFIADMRVRWTQEGMDINSCPADGMALAFADAPTDAVGGTGGNIGLFANPDVLGRFIALDINTWYGQGLGTGDCSTNTAKGETLAFNNMKIDCPGCLDDEETGRSGYDRHVGQDKPGDPAKGGIRTGQVAIPAGMKIVNGGAWRYHWNVDGATNTVTAYMTGLDDANKQFQKVKVLEVKSGIPVLDFEGRWGVTATTGGAVQITEVFAARIEAPMVAP